MLRDHAPQEPKPFFWIGLDKGNPPSKDKPTGQQRFEGLSGRLTLEIEVLSEYLYVGSGLIELDAKERAYYAFARRNEQLIVPATSIKGTVRSVVEAISNSCVSQVGRGERALHSHERCKEVKKGEEDKANLCLACRLFGITGYRGRVHFSDALPVTNIGPQIIKIAELWPPKRTQGRKFYQAKVFQRLNDQPEKNHRFLEVVPKGTRFVTTLFFENTTVAEMGVLVRALGLDRHTEKPDTLVYACPIKLGGAKPRCLGAVRFHPKGLSLLPGFPAALLQALTTGGENKPIKETLLSWIEETSLLDLQAWERFRKEAQSKPESCPKELY